MRKTEKRVRETVKRKRSKPRRLPPVDKQGRGKKYLETAKLVEPGKLYSLSEALRLIGQTSPTKFEAAVEAHIKLGLDASKAEQSVRGTVLLPAGSGRSKKIAVIAKDEDLKAAEAAGADFAGEKDLMKKIEEGWLGFDVLIATPEMMPALGKLGKILGAKGLMPNPKSGTVTQDVAKTVQEFKKGKVEFRADKGGILHVSLGRVSFSQEQLKENFEALLKAVRAAKPAGSKGVYLSSIALATTMGPGIKIDLASI